MNSDCKRNDVTYIIQGDCWVLAAVADLTTNEKLFQKVVPQEQSFDKGRYAGKDINQII